MIIRENNIFSTEAYTRLTKSPVHWSSNILINYKQKTITSELHRAKKLTKNFEKKIRRIKKKLHAAHPIRFISDTLFRFNKKKNNC